MQIHEMTMELLGIKASGGGFRWISIYPFGTVEIAKLISY